MTRYAQPYIAKCDLCESDMAAIPGPENKYPRSAWTPLEGTRIGYIVELADRYHTICRPCLDSVLKTAA